MKKKKELYELHKEGKTIRAIAPLVHMSFGPISKIIKAYDKKIELETKKRENNQESTTKKLSLHSKLLFSTKKVNKLRKLKFY